VIGKMVENRLVEITQETCLTCGCSFWITKKHQQNLIQTKNNFYCPNGHSQCYRGEPYENTIGKLKNDISVCKNIRQQKEQEIENLEKSVKSYKMLFRREQKKNLKIR
jgi:hypothetical protein